MPEDKSTDKVLLTGEQKKTDKILSDVATDIQQSQMPEYVKTGEKDAVNTEDFQPVDPDSYAKMPEDYYTEGPGGIYTGEDQDPEMYDMPSPRDQAIIAAQENAIATGKTEPTWGEWLGDKAKDVGRYVARPSNIVRDIVNKPSVKKFRGDFVKGFSENRKTIKHEVL